MPLQLGGEEDIGGFADGVAGQLVANASAMGRGGRNAGVGEVGRERESEVRHHLCVASGGDLGGMVVSGDLIVTKRVSYRYDAHVGAFSVGCGLQNRQEFDREKKMSDVTDSVSRR